MRTISATSADGGTTATFVPDAGMVCCSLCVDGEQRLSLRRGLDAYARQGSTMGVPLLYPWANRLAGHEYEAAGRQVALPHDPGRVHEEASGLPLHGLTPETMRWRALSPGDGGVAAELQWSDPDLLELFPYVHRVVFSATVTTAGLTVTTTVQATGADPVPVSFGFHPYLALIGAPRHDWSIELPPCRGLELDSRGLPTGGRLPVERGPVGLAERSFDDAYALDQATARFVARAPGRELTVELLEGYRFAQVFSPPEAEFVCFEPMTAPANALRSGDGLLVLAPGQEHRATFALSAP